MARASLNQRPLDHSSELSLPLLLSHPFSLRSMVFACHRCAATIHTLFQCSSSSRLFSLCSLLARFLLGGPAYFQRGGAISLGQLACSHPRRWCELSARSLVLMETSPRSVGLGRRLSLPMVE